jgi:hypothetical protein
VFRGPFRVYSAILGGLLLLSAADADAQALFSAARDFGAGPAPSAIATADLDSDGHADLAVADGLSATIHLLLGSGTGMFTPGPSLSTGAPASAIAAGDVNGDGHADLAVVCPSIDLVVLELSNGDGTFLQGSSVAVPSDARCVLLVDVNGDARLDLVTGHAGPKSIAVRPGNGDGTFGKVAEYPAGIAPSALASADLDGDARPDLGVSGAGAASVGILMNLGDGSLRAPALYSTTSGSRGVALADLDGDGRPDLLAGNSSSNTVTVRLGLGAGSFGEATDYAVGAGPAALAIADVDGDAHPDLLAACSAGNAVSVLLGNGDGSFHGRTDYPVGPAPVDLRAARLDAGARWDIVTANSGAGSVSVLLARVPGPHVNVSPPSLAFGSARVGVVDSLKLTIGDDGTEPLVVSAMDSDSPHFVPGGPTSFSVAPGGARDVWIRFSRSTAGSHSATLTIASNDPSNPSLALALSGSATVPPAIDVSPDSLTLTVAAGDSTAAALSIANQGGGALDWSLATVGTAPAWLEFTPAAGTVAPGAATEVAVRVRATGLDASSYRVVARVLNNDPLRPAVEIPVRLSVTGAPRIVAIPDRVDFGTGVESTADTAIVRIHNFGTDVLNVTAVEVGGSGFEVLDPAPFSLLPRADHDLQLRLVRIAIGTVSGALTVTSNDPAAPSLAVPLSGIVLGRPIISASPDSFGLSLVSGDSTSRPLVIFNSGLSPLTFQLGNPPRVALSRARLSLRDSVYSRNDPQPSARPGVSALGDPPRWRSSAAPRGTALILGDGGTEVDVGAALVAAGFAPTYVSSVAAWSGADPSPQGFSLVVLLDGVGFGSDMPAEGQTALLDYVGAGGGLVVTEWAAWEVSNGRYQGLTPLIPVTRTGGATGIFNHAVVADHPVTAGVSAIFRVTSGVGLGVRNSGTVVVELADGSPAVVTKGYGRGRLVYFAQAGNYFGFRPFLGADMQRLLANAADWTSGSTWLSAAPASGEIPPGGSAQLQVGFSARTLPAGLYTDLVRITSNDPVQPLLGLPVRMAVSIAPILVVPDTLSFGSRPVGVTDTLALRIRNGGSDQLDVTGMTLDSADFTLLGAAAFSLAVGQQLDVPIRLERGHAGDFVAPLVITSNDLARERATVILSGSAFDLPSALVSPDSIEIALAAGDTASALIEVSNWGPGTLHYSVAFAVSSVPWLSFIPGSGVVAPGGRQSIRVLVDARGLFAGAYTTALRVLTDDPAHSEWPIPVLARVSGVPRAGVTPGGLDFGSDFVGYPRVLEVSLSNSGSDTLHVTSTSVGSAEIGLSGGGPFELAPTRSHNITVEYRRVAAGVLDDTLLIASDDPDGLLAIPLSGESREPPAASVLPESLFFAIASGGHASTQLQVRNTGGGRMEWSLETVPAGVGWLTISPATGSKAPDSTTSVKIELDGSALTAGTYPLIVRCTTDDPLRPVITIPVRVTVSGVPRLAVSPVVLDFGRGFLGVRDSLRLRLTNVGTDVLQASSLASDSPEFTFPGSGAATLTPGAVRDVWVTYRRTVADSLIAALTIASNDPITPLLPVPLRGSAVYAPSLAVAPGAFDLVAVARDSTTATLSLTNAGPGDLDYQVRVSGALAPWLRFTPDRGHVAAAGLQDIAVVASAAALDAGVFQTTLQVTSNDPARPIVDLLVRFTVTGTPHVAASPETLRFGTLWVGYPATLPVVLLDSGTDSLRFTSAALTNPHFALADPLPAALGPGRETTLRVRFTPTGEGSQAGDLEIGTNDPDRPVTRVRLEGTGREPSAASLSVPAITFALDQDDTAHATVRVRNSGLGPLTFSGANAPGWLRLAPVTATVPPLDSIALDLRADAGGLPPGVFPATIQFSTNDPGNPTLLLAAQLTVHGIPPAVPASPSPGEGSANVPRQPALRWSAAARALSYDLYLWPASDPRPAAPTVTGLTSPVYFPPVLSTGAAFRWQVVATNATASTPGPEWGFTTERIADLTVSLVEAPVTAYSSQVIQVRWEVANQGDAPTNVPGWIDRVYLSATPNFDLATATVLGDKPNASYLGTGERYAETGQFTLPRGIDGSYFVFVITDVAGSLREQDDGNNTGRCAAPIAVTLTPTADLRVTTVSATGPVNGGDPLLVQWTVSNTGSAATLTGSWTDAIYLSTSPTFDIDGSTLLATRPHSGILDQGGSYAGSYSVTTPRRINGLFYVHVVTDVGDRVYEHAGEVNNASHAEEPLLIHMVSPPDLVVSDLIVPPSEDAGTTMDVVWTDFNEGAGPTYETYWEDRIYISRSPQFDGTATYLASLANYLPLDNGMGRSRERTVTLPNGISGDWYVYVWTNADARVFEYQSNGNNITRSDAPVAIQVPAWPNLVVATVPVPPHVTAGSTLSSDLGVENRGAGRIPELYWRDDLYLSTSPVWSPDQGLLVGRYTRSGPLDVGQGYSVPGRIPIPEGAQGTYYLYCVTDASNLVYEHVDEGDNITRSAPFVIDPLPAPDLVAEVTAIPASTGSGFPIDISYTVRNLGGGDTRVSAWEDRVYFSETPAWDPTTSTLLATYGHGDGLASGGRYVGDHSVIVPNGISGNRWLIVVADYFRAVPDPVATNNIAISSTPIDVHLTPPPDLVVSATTLPDPFNAGQPANVAWQVENRGPGETRPGDWYDAVYFSNDAALDPGDPQVASVFHHGALPAGEHYPVPVSAEILIPNYAGGAAYLLFRCDSRGEVFQFATGNDVVARAIDVIVPPPSDLIVTSVMPPATAIPGRPVTIAWTIRNIGQNPARGWMWDAVYVSADASYDASDPRLPLVYRHIDLAPGASMQLSARVDVAEAAIATDLGSQVTDATPGVTPGAYHVIVRTDIRNSLRESDEGNNSLASTETMDVDILELALGASANDFLPAGEARYYKFRETGGNTARVKLTGSPPATANEVFVSLGRTPTLSDFDIGFNDPMSPDQDVLIPKTSDGTYYVLVQSRSASGNIAIVAENLLFELTSVSNRELGNGGPVTLIVNGGLLDRATSFGLRLADGLVRPASSFRIDDAATATVRFDLLGAAPGPAVLFADAAAGGLHAEFATPLTVLDHGGPDLAARIAGPENMRPGQTAMFTLEYGNLGYNDAYDALIWVKIPSGVEIVIERPGFGLVPYPLPASKGEDYLEWIVATRLYARTSRSVPIAVRATGTGSMAFETRIIEMLPLDPTANAPAAPAARVPRFRLVPENEEKREGQAVFRESPPSLLPWELPWSHVGIVVQYKRATDGPMQCTDSESPSGQSDCVDEHWYVVDAVNGYKRPDGTTDTGIRPPVPYDDWMNPAKDHGGVYRGRTEPVGWTTTAARTIHDAALNEVRNEASADLTHYWFFGELRNVPLPDVVPRPGLIFTSEQIEALSRVGVSMFTTQGQFGNYNCIGFVEHLYDQAGIGQIQQHALYPPGIYFEDMTGKAWPRPEWSPSGFQRTLQEVVVFAPERMRSAAGQVIAASKQSAIMYEAALETGLRALWDGSQAAGQWFRESWGDVRNWYQSNNREFKQRWHTFEDWYVDLMSGRSVWRFIVRRASDPNDIVGPEGVSARRWVPITQTLAYAVRFENDSTVADAAVQSLTVTQPIDPGLEMRSFRLGSFGFGPWTWQVPENRSFYSTRLDLRDSLGLYVDVVAGLDVVQRRAYWSLRAINPATQEPPTDPLIGFLPPNDDAQRGQGFFTYSIQPADSTQSGTRVEALARIVFDTNDPVDTPPAFNTVDALPPESHVRPLPQNSDEIAVEVAWTGHDTGDGSGVASYDVYVQRDSEPFELWKSETPDTSAVFEGAPGSTYSFYSIARDSTGLVESAPGKPDAAVTLNTPTAVKLSLVSATATAESVTLTWYSGAGSVSATLYRATHPGEWSARGTLQSDGTGMIVHTDHDVVSGERYGYRLGVIDGSEERFLGEAWVDVPRPVLALYGAQPNPATSDLAVSFSLAAREPATLEAYDIAGRRVASLPVGHLGPGPQLVRLGHGRRIEPGIYVLRLSAGNRRLTAKTAVVR